MSEFVSSEIAYKLKEKRYPLLRVIKQRGEPIIYDLPKNHPNWQNCNAYYIPTISQVLKWFRNEKKLHILLTDVSIRGSIEWDFQIDDLNTSDIIYESRLIYNSYEEAVIAGIEYVLDNLI